MPEQNDSPLESPFKLFAIFLVNMWTNLWYNCYTSPDSEVTMQQRQNWIEFIRRVLQTICISIGGTGLFHLVSPFQVPLSMYMLSLVIYPSFLSIINSNMVPDHVKIREEWQEVLGLGLVLYGVTEAVLRIAWILLPIQSIISHAGNHAGYGAVELVLLCLFFLPMIDDSSNYELAIILGKISAMTTLIIVSVLLTKVLLGPTVATIVAILSYVILLLSSILPALGKTVQLLIVAVRSFQKPTSLPS
ncbi:hypothetical protein [Haloarcula sebkhae]|uniref:Uncharacterized protein n=1 Tax=Haloarcula sebkhae TaxID=932660 RepID=A0ACC6VLB5_9EURY|nr:hypothetical protein [Haloarcula sebkhae]